MRCRTIAEDSDKATGDRVGLHIFLGHVDGITCVHHALMRSALSTETLHADSIMIALALVPLKIKVVVEEPNVDLWQFKPQYDGVRALFFHHGDAVTLSIFGMSRAGILPEVVTPVATLPAQQIALDVEPIAAGGETRSFDATLPRLSPSLRQIAKLAREAPRAAPRAPGHVGDRRPVSPTAQITSSSSIGTEFT